MDTNQLLEMMAFYGSLNTTSQQPDPVSAVQQSRGSFILEPILEEETDEEEQARWSLQSYESSTSSGDSCDSVVQLAEVNFLPGARNTIDDTDTVSERDFLCPAKRRKQELFADSFNIPSCLKVNNKIRFDSFEPDYHKKRYRLDDSVFDYPSDTESSLSRSSSLIQFESLERQMQSENQSFSSSSPLLNIGHSIITPVVDQDFERFIPLQQQQQQLQHSTPVTVSIKTKASTPYSSSSLDNSIVCTADKHHRLINGGASSNTLSTFSNPSTFTVASKFSGRGRISTLERISPAERDPFAGTLGKSSQEELSEDSGYCGDHSLLQSIGSGSTEGGCDAFSSKQSASSDELDGSSMQPTENDDDSEEVNRERGLKIAANYTKRERHSPNTKNVNCSDSEISGVVKEGEQQQLGCGGLLPSCVDDCEEEMEVAINTRENKRPRRKKNIPLGAKQKLVLGGCQRTASRSLPNIFLNQTVSDETHPSVDHCTSSRESALPKGVATVAAISNLDDLSDDQYLKVNSFPEGLNYLLSGGFAEDSDECEDYEECQEFFSNDYYFLNENHGDAATDYYQDSGVSCGGTIASKNLDLNQLIGYQSNEEQVLQQQSRAGVLSASYSNLTALDYSENSPVRLFSKMDTTNAKRVGNNSNLRPTIANPEITLLDEISFNFDKNLSILNDRCGNFEPLIEDEHGEEEEEADNAIIGILNIRRPPKPPPRRYRKGDSLENLTVPTAPVIPSSTAASSRESLTFDRDPTNLVTCYAASLERCNFQTLDQPTTSTVMSYQRNTSTTSLQTEELPGTLCKEMVVSTPNLSVRQDLQVFEISADNKSRTFGNVSSRSSLYKEVSFNPIVSEISWRQQQDEVESDSLSEDSLDGDEQDAVNRGSDSDVESDGGKYREDDAPEDYFGLKRNENFKDLDLTGPAPKSEATDVLPVMATAAAAADCHQKQTITIKKTNIILIPEIERATEETTDASYSKEPVTAKDKEQGCENINNLKVLKESSENAIKFGESVESDHSEEKRHKKNNNNNSSSCSSIAIMPITSSSTSSSPAHEIAPSKKRKSSFFSRLSSFRFSLKNSKKEHQVAGKNDHITPVVHPCTTASSPPPTPGKRSNANNTFVHIPLKDPVDQLDHFSKQKLAIQRQLQAEQLHTNNNMQMRPPPRVETGRPFVNKSYSNGGGGGGNRGGIIPLDTSSSMSSSCTSSPERLVLHKKPPLPKHPPRVIGVCAKKCADANSQKGTPSYGEEKENRDNNNNQNQSLTSGVGGESEDSYQFASHNPRRAAMQANGVAAKGGAATAGSFSKIGLIETNLDTHETIISGKTRSLMELHPQGPQRIRYSHQIPPHQRVTGAVDGRQSLGAEGRSSTNGPADVIRQRPHKSMEFLLDKENQLYTLPPENELQKIHETPMLSEHQLRVQASLQKLNIPDWYRQYNDGSRGDLRSPSSPAPVVGSGGSNGSQFNYRKRGSSGVEGSGIPPSSSGGHAKWTGLSSKTTSLSSLGGGSQRYDKNSSLLLSPSSHSHHGGTTTITTGYSRWSTSHLNSAQTSPSNSTAARTPFTRGNYAQNSGHSFIHSANNGTNIRGSYRQPYLGWRSQEKLSQSQGLRTPAERLASTLIAAQQPTATNGSGQAGEETEIQSSIKEVTSAIVHFVNDQTNRNQNPSSRSRSASPSKKCWVESSFVGTGRLVSPQTPPVLESQPSMPLSEDIRRYDITSAELSSVSLRYANASAAAIVDVTPRISTSERSPRPGSASLEDVLSSLLGLPPSSMTGNHRHEAIFNSYQGCMGANRVASASNSLNVNESLIQRRRSEGDARQGAPKNVMNSNKQETSECVTNAPAAAAETAQSCTVEMLKCQYPRCESRATEADAKKTFKSCQHCSHLYCSRECRRGHWEQHRKACLHSRVSALCRQVLSACKDDLNTLRNLTLMARRGYLLSGRGIVRILFRSPEAAESFLRQGYSKLGEASYVRSPADLVPSEMGPELYSELLRLSTEYKPESKMLIYAAICVVSENPSSRISAPVRWERQLVSRCAKLKLCKTALREIDESKLLATSDGA